MCVCVCLRWVCVCAVCVHCACVCVPASRKILSNSVIAFFNVLKQRVGNEPGGFSSRNDKAEAVKRTAGALLDDFTKFQCEESVNYYLHCAFHHLPDIVRECPIEVDDASGCCIEHAHQSVKRAML